MEEWALGLDYTPAFRPVQRTIRVGFDGEYRLRTSFQRRQRRWPPSVLNGKCSPTYNPLIGYRWKNEIWLAYSVLQACIKPLTLSPSVREQSSMCFYAS